MDNGIRDIDFIEDKALDITERIKCRKATDMDDMEIDGEVAERLKDLTALAEAADSQTRDDDVERRLQQFYRKQQAKSSRLRLLRVAIASVACVAALFTLAVWKVSPDSAQVQEEQPLIFNIAKPKASIIVKTEKGRKTQKITDSEEEFAVESVLTEGTERLVVDVPQGERLTVALPDGSKVYLHADSRLKFPSRFTGMERVVELTGEAYFVVSRDPGKPFVVNTPTMQTTVLGTEFNIVAEGTDPGNVALVSGSVEIKAAGTQQIIKPGQQLTVTAQGKFEIQEVDTTPYTSWRDGYIYFDDITLKEALLHIAKEFNCNVEFRNPDVLDNKVHFVAVRSEGMKGIVDGLNMMGVVSVVMEGNTLIVM